jgi:hypothetical protein
MPPAAPVPDFTTALARGIALFNEQRFFEAHEVWEDRWRVETGGLPEDADRAARALLLHGLIQIAAGFVKLQRGEPRGTMSLLGKGVAKLESLPGTRFPIDLPALLADVARWRKAEMRAPAGGTASLDPSGLPRITPLSPPHPSSGTNRG